MSNALALNEQVVLVTGGARGLGAAISRAFLREGARVVVNYRNSREAALAKLHATDSAQQVIDKAVQIFGGLGVTHGVPVESLYREIRALRIYEGASEVQKVVIARNHLEAFGK